MRKLKGRSSFLRRGHLVHYDKPFKSVDDQLSLLQERGVQISDPDRARHHLSRIGYYRLSGYAFPFKEIDDAGNVLDRFKQGVEFQNIIELYVFDKKLRMQMLDAIERIEVGLRTLMVAKLGSSDPWFYRDPNKLDGKFAKHRQPPDSRTNHEKWLKKIDESFSRSREPFAIHFKNKYTGEPPIWISTEIWDFGSLSKLYSGLLYNDRCAISEEFSVKDPTVFESWLIAMNICRNTCAHHARLWNRPLVRQIKVERHGSIPCLDHLALDGYAQTRLYGVAAVTRFLLLRLNPATMWHLRLRNHIEAFPKSDFISISNMGFTESWGELELWRQ